MEKRMADRSNSGATIRLQNEPWLLTPGPLTTAASVKQAMLRDWGSWDGDFCELSAELRGEVLSIANASPAEYTCVPIQGSGTFVVEAMLGSLLSSDSKTLVLANGAYGKRCAETLRYLGREHVVLDKGDYLPPRGREVDELLSADPAITHVVAIHCETSSGILNPLAEIARVVKKHQRKLLIDSMSGFGALPLRVSEIDFEAFVSSANKCIEGVPGFGFVVVRKQALEAAAGNSHSLSLDLHAQWQYMEKTGQWRFTPPTHTIAAFVEALRLHRLEGGAKARLDRYTENRNVMVPGMRQLGFATLLQDRWLSPIIVTFFNPADPAFKFDVFYELLKRSGFIIYPGKLTMADSFRIGCIGKMNSGVMHDLVSAVGDALDTMGVEDAAAPEAVLRERDDHADF